MARRKTDGRRLTILDIAREAGVSEVDSLHSNAGQPRDPTRNSQRVHQPIDPIGYIYIRSATSPPAVRHGRLVINDLTNPFFAEMTVGLEAACRAPA